MSVLEVRDLRVELRNNGVDIVSGISFHVDSGEVIAVVGESGSGKTTVGLSLLGHVRPGARIVAGSVRLDEVEVLKLSPAELRRLRGSDISYVAQDPSASLNPALRIGEQVDETLAAHGNDDKAQRLERVRTLLSEVELPNDGGFLSRYPHQLSGGQQQRVVIAMAFACRPKIIVCDEPTTGLDVSTQAKVLETLRSLCSKHGVGAVYISHDLGVVAELADRVLVLYAGRIAELGSRDQIFRQSAHPYARGLMAAVPDLSTRLVLRPVPGKAPSPGDRPSGCFFRPRCEFAEGRCMQTPPVIEVASGHHSTCWRAEELKTRRHQRMAVASAAEVQKSVAILTARDIDASYGQRQVLRDVSLDLHSGECLALVGESGSGKTTLSRVIIGLLGPTRGEVRFEGRALEPEARSRPLEVRRRLQYIFQSPYNSLNPRITIGDSVGAPAEHFFGERGGRARSRVAEVLERVAISPRYIDRFPDQLSGGERQRVAIARALICEPIVLVCDEITSALDVSVQAAIVELLRSIREERGLSLLFVTHDLALVRSIADRVIVMNRGAIVESGTCSSVLTEAEHDYTKSLIASTPRSLIDCGVVAGSPVPAS